MKNKQVSIKRSIILLSVLFLLVCAGSAQAAGGEEITDIRLLKPGTEYTGRGTLAGYLRSPDRNYSTIQGGYFDGEHYIICYTRSSGKDEVVLICEFDADMKCVRQSEAGLPLDHANCITYINKSNQYLVSHCQGSTSFKYYTYSLVDADTFEIVETAMLQRPFFAMAYCPEKDMFASGEWGGETIDIWDGSLNPIRRVSVEPPKSLSQGVFCDAEAIYFVRSAQNTARSEIRIYDWDANPVRNIQLSIAGEPESISIVDGNVYVITNGGIVFQIAFTAVQ